MTAPASLSVSKSAHQKANVRCAWRRCREPFAPERSTGRFCSTACRVSHHRATKRRLARNEWFTPSAFLEPVRAALGGDIELDPASSSTANETVRARRCFTARTNGLKQSWASPALYCNPPYSQPAIVHFAEKMVAEWRTGRIEAAVMLTHNYTDTEWFHTLAAAADALCFTRGRVKFYDAQGTVAAPTQGQTFLYFGSRVDRFREAFSSLGLVLVPGADVRGGLQ
jgi:hypothetical protein